jgi:cell wall assembly regulator SMI1
MQITKSRPYGPVDSAALSELEAQIGNPLPESFRAFLIEHNGPSIAPCEFHVDDYIDGIDGELYGLHQNKEKDLREAYFHSSQDWPPDLLPFASDGGGNEICVGLSGPKEGKVYFIDHELYDEDVSEAGVIHLTDSLEAFFEGLFEYEEKE